MDKTIKLEAVEQRLIEGCVFVDYNFKVNGQTHILNFKVSSYPPHCVTECAADRCDAFVVSLINYALSEGYDIESKVPISEKLYYNLTKHFIPLINESNPHTTYPIKINAPISDKVFDGSWVGTGISCGIDSLTTLKEYTIDCELEDYKITHLLYFKIGAHHGLRYPTPVEVEDQVFNEELSVVKDFCNKYDYPLIVVESNINDLCFRVFGHLNFECVVINRNCGTMLLLQNMFRRYYAASSYSGFTHFNLDLSQGLEHSEWWSISQFSTDSLSMAHANMSMNRIEKTIYISDFEPSYDNLMVCWKSHKNCGFCPKCVRTLITLDLIGKLDKYSKSFDIELYKKYRKRLFHRVVALRNKDTFFNEIYRYMKDHDIPTPNPLMSKISVKYQFNRKKLPVWLDKLIDKIIPV